MERGLAVLQRIHRIDEAVRGLEESMGRYRAGKV